MQYFAEDLYRHNHCVVDFHGFTIQVTGNKFGCFVPLQYVKVVVIVFFPTVIFAGGIATNGNQFAVPHLPEHGVGGHIEVYTENIASAIKAFESSGTINNSQT